MEKIMCALKIGDIVDSYILKLVNPASSGKYDFKSWVEPIVSLWNWRINGAIIDDLGMDIRYFILKHL